MTSLLDRPKGFNLYLVPMLHGLGWLLYAGTVIYVVIPRVSFPFLIAYHGGFLLSQAIAFYSTYLYSVPQLLARQKFVVFWVFTVFLLLLLLTLSVRFYNGVGEFIPGPEFQAYPLTFRKRIPARLLGLILVTGLAVFSRLTIDWVAHRQRKTEQENEYLQMELTFLKAQLNPHFLLNTLNSLYALALKQSPQTPDVIMKLSQLMRYMLYETADAQLPLQKEVEAIQHYIDLQELRLSALNTVLFTQDGPIHTTQVPPFLLLPLVENMFKHGRLPMSIQLVITDKQVELKTRNGLRDHPPIDSVGGIGLTNLRRRLDILYPGRYKLISSTENGFFLIEMILQR